MAVCEVKLKIDAKKLIAEAKQELKIQFLANFFGVTEEHIKENFYFYKQDFQHSWEENKGDTLLQKKDEKIIEKSLIIEEEINDRYIDF